MNDPHCWPIVERLLENPESPSPDDVSHVRDCKGCNSMIAQAAKLESLVALDQELPPHAGEELIERTTKRSVTTLKRVRLALDFLVAAIVATGAAFWFIVAGFYAGWAPFIGRPRGTYFSDTLWLLFPVSTLLGAVLGRAIARLRVRTPVVPSAPAAWLPLLLTIALLAEYHVARHLALEHVSWFAVGIGAAMLTAATAGFLPGGAGIPYKRLRNGRQLSGVCAGIAEATRVPVSIIRLTFIALVLAKHSGFVLYIMLDLLMEVHPDDRSSLLRFRIRRWWEDRSRATVARSA